MEFRILGPVEAVEDGHALPLGGGKQRALLAALLLQPNRVVSTERLVELLWGDEAPETAHNILQVYVSQLRKVLEPVRRRDEPPRVVVAHAAGYALHVDPEHIDVEQFEQLVRVGRQALSAGQLEDALQTLQKALALWRGLPMANVAVPFVESQRARLEARRLDVLEDRIDTELGLGQHVDVVAELEALAAAYPMRERLCGQLMLALYRSGRQAEASAAYHQLRRALDQAEGMEPGPALQQLLTRILNQDPELELKPRSVPQPEPRKVTLPLQLTSFVGRENQVREVGKLIGSNRLVTLTGSGGVGKTRLALEVASGRGGMYPNGIWLVELGSLADPALVPQAIATALGIHVQVQRSVVDTLIEALHSQELLIVLDNCEHLADASARIVEKLLQNCAALRVLATSREPLRVTGEAIWTVSPMELPPIENRAFQTQQISGFEAVRLFIERAASVRSGFTVTNDNAKAVVEVCRRLDGVPLALELAAARLAGLSIDDLAERLHQRFRLLVEGRRTAAPRQQTLRATIDWSYQLLDEAERVMFARLSVFAGGWTVESAERICAGDPIETDEVVPLLLRLVDKSLVAVNPATTNAAPRRYRLLETVREYAREQLNGGGLESRPERGRVFRRA